MWKTLSKSSHKLSSSSSSTVMIATTRTTTTTTTTNSKYRSQLFSTTPSSLKFNHQQHDHYQQARDSPSSSSSSSSSSLLTIDDNCHYSLNHHHHWFSNHSSSCSSTQSRTIFNSSCWNRSNKSDHQHHHHHHHRTFSTLSSNNQSLLKDATENAAPAGNDGNAPSAPADHTKTWKQFLLSSTRLFMSLLKKLFKILLYVPLGLAVTLFSIYALMKGCLELFYTLKLDDPEEHTLFYYEPFIQWMYKMESAERFIRAFYTLFVIAADYFLVLDTSPKNPAYWFREKPDKNSESFKELKSAHHRLNAIRLKNLFCSFKGIYIKVSESC